MWSQCNDTISESNLILKPVKYSENIIDNCVWYYVCEMIIMMKKWK